MSMTKRSESLFIILKYHILKAQILMWASWMLDFCDYLLEEFPHIEQVYVNPPLPLTYQSPRSSLKSGQKHPENIHKSDIWKISTSESKTICMNYASLKWKETLLKFEERFNYDDFYFIHSSYEPDLPIILWWHAVSANGNNGWWVWCHRAITNHIRAPRIPQWCHQCSPQQPSYMSQPAQPSQQPYNVPTSRSVHTYCIMNIVSFIQCFWPNLFLALPHILHI